MGRLEQALREEVTRLARKESKNAAESMASEVAQLRAAVKGLQQELSRVEKLARARTQRREGAAPRVRGARGRASTPRGAVGKIRTKLDLTQTELAVLIGVSPSAVTFWETGRTKPRPVFQRRLDKLSGLSKEGARRLLTGGRAPAVGARPASSQKSIASRKKKAAAKPAGARKRSSSSPKKGRRKRR